MTYLVIGLVIAFIVAPILAILPSARQKQQMLLRRKAMAAGIHVDISRIDDPVPKQEKYLSNFGKQLPPHLTVTAYRRNRPRSAFSHRHKPVGWAVERRASPGSDGLPGTWAWLPARPPRVTHEFAVFLADALGHLPEDAVRADEANGVISVYWHERTGEAGLGAVLDFIDGATALQAGFQPDDSDDVDDLS
ncbi:MAG: hypothetical protein O2780_18710 [Proteobacteria bacterium]|nr:hypothetical protein [Pseudomonadota bacterium]MDA1301680.1 hypothetical protein [Pseudomonadota bacterium]